MPSSPSVAVETLRPDLSLAINQFSLEADQEGMVGTFIAPIMEVDVAADVYTVVVLKEMLKKRRTNRNSDGSYNRGGGKFEKQSYECEEHGFEEPVDRREARRFANWVKAEVLAAQRSRDAVVRNHNQRVVDLALAVGTTTAAGTAWSTTATADPVKNVRDGQIAIRNRTGMTANAGVIDWEAFQYLRDCDTILARIKYDGHHNVEKDNIDENMMARALGLQHLKVSGSMVNNGNENKAASLAAQWDKTKMLLFCKYEGDDTQRPQFARTFHWGADGSRAGGVFETYYSPDRRQDVVRNRMDTDETVLYGAAAQLITGVL